MELALLYLNATNSHLQIKDFINYPPRMRFRKLLVLAALSSAVTTLNAAPAMAHTRIAKSSPGINSVIKNWPSKVTIIFNENLITLNGASVNRIEVTNSQGVRIDEGATKVSGSSASAQLKGGQSSGRYTVTYRVVSSDGHPVTNTYSFTFISGPSK